MAPRDKRSLPIIGRKTPASGVTFLRYFAQSLAALGFAASIGAAHAGTYNYSSYSLLNGASVTLQDSKIGVNESGSAGQITLNATSGPSLSTFCFDIKDILKGSGSFTTGSFLTNSIADAVNALISHVAPLLGSDTNASAALQVAIWKTEYGSDLTVTSQNASVLSKADDYRQQVSSGAWQADRTMALAFLNGGGGNQDQIYLSKVPEPTTIALLGAGLLGLCGVRGRRRGRQALS